MEDGERVTLPFPDLGVGIREALLAIEGAVLSDFKFPLPGDLKDLAKASDLVSGVVEDRIPALLNSVRSTTWDEDGKLGDYEWRKFAIGFPDILLVRRSDPTDVLFEIEAKSWYILSNDPLTARFLTSQTVINDGTLVVVVAWMLDGVVSGSPVLLRLYVDDARRLAQVRDDTWRATPPLDSHRVVDPDNEIGTPRNLLKTQVRGEMRSAAGTWHKDSDNFGKLDRLYDDQLRAFRDGVWDLTAAGKPLRSWHRFIKRDDA
ncbi:MAG: hypothetical protein QOI82_3156 [Actinomycetota bacterium]|nr:hypothetical protein [Actinomycetota bacterium]